VLKLDSFKEMSRDDFKTSKGNGSCFDGLKVGVYSELCTLGINSEKLKPAQGNHLSPKEFHEKLEELSKSSHLSTGNETLLLDCRNFYESKIGFFDGALKPDLRKFSYFKEYVDKNQELFRNRKVLSYCTGGIRCERASAYIQQSTNCLEVYQLKGGIHKYLEEFPHSDFYKGKLFVFDNRFGININGKEHTVVSSCIYCPTLCDTYELCTTNGCCQLVLICKSCRDKGVTTCCDNCAENAKQKCVLKHCKCTEIRERTVKEI
uniref:Rhodanese domain-containing protein n=1 Tax=Ciona savignyi TaxID=51511 RepID=H2Z876_CIOSA